MLRPVLAYRSLLLLAALAVGIGAAGITRAASVRAVPPVLAACSVRELLPEALIAEGASPSESDAIVRQWQRVVQEARERVGRSHDRRQAAATALSLIYQRVTTGRYIADCTSLRRAFGEGVYNCVSITILYQSLCDELGLATTALARPGHVLCRVWLGEGRPGGENDLRWQRVETTCRQWFEREGARPEAHPGTGTLRAISPAELVAKIYYNRGVELLHRQDYDAAVAITELAWQLDLADARARDNHLAALNNGAISLVGARRFDDARIWLARARGIDPNYALLGRNEAYLRQMEAAEGNEVLP